MQRLFGNRGGMLLGGLLLLSGCDGLFGSGPPSGAIQVHEDFYMVPGDCDKYGYREYHPWSEKQPVMPIIYYKMREGGFSHDSAKSEISGDCN